MVELETPPPQRHGTIPPLENGESLNSTEFLRRYETMPDGLKAELIQGIVYLRSPVSLDHGEPDSLIQGWLVTYAIRTPGVKSATNTTAKLSAEDVLQPDGLLRILPEYGGRTQAGKYLEGAPELGVEIGVSSSSMDANAKKTSYRRAGMQEYMLWRTRQNEIDWWRLVDDDYQLIEADEQGILKSEVFPGLWLAPQALLNDDGERVLAILNEGLASLEHAAFVDRLKAAQG